MVHPFWPGTLAPTLALSLHEAHAAFTLTVKNTLAELRELYNYRELLFHMVNRDLKVRYKNSFFGFLWSFFNPLLSVAVITYMMEVVVGSKVHNMSAYILAGYLPYSFFTTSIMDATSSVNNGLQLIKKNYFPREILPLASVLSNFVHLLLAMVMFFCYLLFIWIIHPGESPFVASVALLPLVLVVNLALSAGLGLLLSSINVFYEDVKYIVSIAMWLLFFLCPVMVLSENFFYGHPLQYKILNIVNPAFVLVDCYRKVLLAITPVQINGVDMPGVGFSWPHFWYLTVVSFVILIIGYRVFNRMKWKFVERP